MGTGPAGARADRAARRHRLQRRSARGAGPRRRGGQGRRGISRGRRLLADRRPAGGGTAAADLRRQRGDAGLRGALPRGRRQGAVVHRGRRTAHRRDRPDGHLDDDRRTGRGLDARRRRAVPAARRVLGIARRPRRRAAHRHRVPGGRRCAVDGGHPHRGEHGRCRTVRPRPDRRCHGRPGRRAGRHRRAVPIGPDPLPPLVAGHAGRTHPGLGPAARRSRQRRRHPAGAGEPAAALDTGRRPDRRRGYRHHGLRRDHHARQAGHQRRAGTFDHGANGLHDPQLRTRIVGGGGDPPDRPRLLQGHAVPVLRFGDRPAAAPPGSAGPAPADRTAARRRSGRRGHPAGHSPLRGGADGSAVARRP